MIDINDEIQELIDVSYEPKSRWVKNMSTRMRVFNGQIFDDLFEGHCKENSHMNYAYMEKTFNKLHVDAYFDETISHREYYDFCDQFEVNRDKLYAKKFEDDE